MSNCLALYWNEFVESLPADSELPRELGGPVAFGFTPDEATEISKLVLSGIKTATGSLLWSYEFDHKAVPRIGELSLVLDGNARPVCVIRATSVETIPFDEVGEAYARWGGEGDLSLASWRAMYWRYISQECKRIGRDPSMKAPLVMERFEVVYSKPRSAT